MKRLVAVAILLGASVANAETPSSGSTLGPAIVSSNGLAVGTTVAPLVMFGPPSIVIDGANGSPLVTIKPDGTIVYGDGYTPDAAAKAFWDAVGRRARPQLRLKSNAVLENFDASAFDVCIEPGATNIRTNGMTVKGLPSPCE